MDSPEEFLSRWKMRTNPICVAMKDVENAIRSLATRIISGDSATNSRLRQQFKNAITQVMYTRLILIRSLNYNRVLWSTSTISYGMAQMYLRENKSLAKNFMNIYGTIESLSAITGGSTMMVKRMHTILGDMTTAINAIFLIFKHENTIIRDVIKRLPKSNRALMTENTNLKKMCATLMAENTNLKKMCATLMAENTNLKKASG